MANPHSPNPGRRPRAERRKEPRFESKGLADLVILNPPKFGRLTAGVLNVSRWGFQLDLDEPIEDGAKIELRLKEVIVSGVVTNCGPVRAGRYRAGVRTVKVIDSPLIARHFSDIDFELYSLGESLSEVQREHYAGHLELCAACKKRVTAPAKTAKAKPRRARKSA